MVGVSPGIMVRDQGWGWGSSTCLDPQAGLGGPFGEELLRKGLQKRVMAMAQVHTAVQGAASARVTVRFRV